MLVSLSTEDIHSVMENRRNGRDAVKITSYRC